MREAGTSGRWTCLLVARQFPTMVSVFALREDHGAGPTPLGTLRLAWLIHDISEHRRMEHELRSACDDLELRVQERTAQLTEANTALTASEAALRQSAAVLTEAERSNRAQPGTIPGALAAAAQVAGARAQRGGRPVV